MSVYLYLNSKNWVEGLILLPVYNKNESGTATYFKE